MHLIVHEKIDLLREREREREAIGRKIEIYSSKMFRENTDVTNFFTLGAWTNNVVPSFITLCYPVHRNLP